MAVTVVELIQLREKAGSWDTLVEQIRLLRAAEDAGNGAKATMGSRPTSLEMAMVTLRKAGKKSQHCGAISELIFNEYGVRVKPHSLGNMLYRSAKAKKNFFKDPRRPNSYGLLEWQ